MDLLEESPSPAAAELPRLRIIHLMIWMAATAAAMLPYQLALVAQKRAESASVALIESAPVTAAAAVNGVASGAYLLVAIAAMSWRGFGVLSRYQPGHWLAFKGTVDWMNIVIWSALYFLSADKNFALLRWIALPQFSTALVIFACFLWLAARSRDGARWRWTYLVVAFIPVLEAVGPAVLAFSMGPSQFMAVYMGSRAVLEVIPAIVLALALAGDKRIASERHWSHWIGSGAFLLALLANAAIYAWYSLSREVLSAQ